TRKVKNKSIKTWYENRGTEYRSHVQNITATGTTGTVLPVTMSELTGKASGQFNQLGWTTFTETNNRGFAIERSVNGIEFSAIDFVASAAASGNSSALLKYSFIDNHLTSCSY